MLRTLVAAKRAGQIGTVGDLRLLEEFIANDGLRGGVTYLNTLVPHRFTAVYRKRRDVMYCMSAFDIEGEIFGPDLQSVPVCDSYCQFVLKDGVFVTEDARRESVLDGHKYQKALLSYVGQPIYLSNGETYGTLCHFDFLERKVSAQQQEFFASAVRVIAALSLIHI